MISAWTSARRQAIELDLLGVLLHASASGVPLPAALDDAGSSVPRRSRATLRVVNEALRTGAGLGAALGRADMPAPFIAAAEAGERSGRLHEALAAHEGSLDWRLEFSRRALDAWTQPLLSLIVAFATLALLVVVGAVPAFVSLTDHPGALARLLRSLASLPGPLPLLLLVALTLGLAALARACSRSPRWQELRERLPIAGPAVREQHRALALRELASLVAAGVPAQDALVLAGRSLPMGSSARRSLALSAERLAGGDVPGAVIDWPLLEALLAMGVPAGALPTLITRAADWHEAEMERISDEAARASGIVAAATAWTACGVIIVLAWSGYFTAVAATGS